MTNAFIMDMDINSMYAWAPLVIKQSLVCKLLKHMRRGKSHHAKIQAKRHLRLYRNAYVEYDTVKDKEWTKKHVSIMEHKVPDEDFYEAVKFLFSHLSDTPEKRRKKCLNETFGSLT